MGAERCLSRRSKGTRNLSQGRLEQCRHERGLQGSGGLVPYPLLNDVVDLNRFDRLFEKNYNENNHPDEGVEQDWAQFFWGYRTDVWPLPTGGLPTDAQIVNIFVFTWKWPKHHGFFADLTGGVSLAVPSPPGNPTASLMRFAATADAAGVNH